MRRSGGPFRHPLQAARRGIKTWQSQHRSHPRGRELIRQSLALYRTNLWKIAAIVLIVIVPTTLLSSYAVDPTQPDTALVAYITFAELAMNAALIWALIELFSGRRVGVREAYYKGSAAIVRLVLVALMLVVMVLPLGLGLAILNNSILLADAGLVLGEKLLLTVLAIAVSVPTFVLLIRGFWSIYIIFEDHRGPWQAIRQSFRITKSRTVLSFRRVVVLVLALVAMLIIPGVLLAVLATTTNQAIFLVVLQILVALIALPISNLYMYSYYRSLK